VDFVCAASHRIQISIWSFSYPGTDAKERHFSFANMVIQESADKAQKVQGSKMIRDHLS
jgi:hypothetical protein